MRDRLNASGGCEAAVTARVRIGWVRFSECEELLLGNRVSLWIKGKIYHGCITSAILYGSKAMCLRKKEKAVLRKRERAIMRAKCSQKLLTERRLENRWTCWG